MRSESFFIWEMKIRLTWKLERKTGNTCGLETDLELPKKENKYKIIIMISLFLSLSYTHKFLVLTLCKWKWEGKTILWIKLRLMRALWWLICYVDYETAAIQPFLHAFNDRKKTKKLPSSRRLIGINKQNISILWECIHPFTAIIKIKVK